jgi:2-methylcitrate dehydratase
MDELKKKDNIARSRVPALGRRDMMKKMGAGVVAAAALSAPIVEAQGRGGGGGGGGQAGPAAAPAAPGSMPDMTLPRLRVTAGYKNTANRLSGNGPMDDTTRQIVKFVLDFNESKLTEPVIYAVHRTLVDSMSAIIAGFEEEPSRISARVAQQAQGSTYKATVFGYGVSTTPELAAFANGVQVRTCDFNDNPGHTSNLIPAALAIGESLHATGAQVMAAICVGYEVSLVPIGYGGVEPIQAAMTAGKLMGLDEDRLANALTIALTPHVALNKGVGALSMWKDARSAEATKCGVWAATLARDGMTGPPQPFEGRGGFWASSGVTRPFTLPVEDKLAIERNWFKRRPAEDSSQGTLDIASEMRAWTKPDEIASIDNYMNPGGMGEIGDAPKWDPRNRETADHSMPYLLSRALIDGDIYLDSFTPEKYLDPAVRVLMNKITTIEVREWGGLGPARIVIRKKNGETRTWDSYNGIRNIDETVHPHFTDEELLAKFNRVCAYKKIDDVQRDRIHAIWSNLYKVKDVGEAIQTVAKYGRPKPLNA